MSPDTSRVLRTADLQQLLDTLGEMGYRVVGPTLRDGAVVWETIRQVSELPIGWRDRQEAGLYRLERTGSAELFGIVHGPQSLKPFVFPPREPLIRIERTRKGLTVHPRQPEAAKVAVVGARACDLAGLAIQDGIFLDGPYRDPYYAVRREGLFVIAVNCTRAHPTCFCASMETGPRAKVGFDVALTEVEGWLLIESGSEAGADLLSRLCLPSASADLIADARKRLDACAESQVRRLDRGALPEGLSQAHDHPHWDEVAARCLACTNCTMVCPTCFCHTVEEAPNLILERTERTRLWDSCFTEEHGYIHGKNLRPTIKNRYRMWLTHKLDQWHDQFGTSGCVGCGRCITWCPVGIDLREEVSRLLGAHDRRSMERGDSRP